MLKDIIMGPLIPTGIVGMEWDLFFAFFIGIAFGYVLEQAGFSSSRKLAGVFYGYDFVVLRVFFTAAITAMTGLLLMNHLGMIDISLVYINPTFLWSAIVGGAIMGVGFILGGFCPGTSVTAAAIGKIDAWAFLLGIAIGILIFGEAYPMFEALYYGSSLGPILVFESLGISAGWFAFILIAVALAAFGITAAIEQKVNKENALEDTKGMSYTLPVSVALLVGVMLIFIPYDRLTSINELPKSTFNEVVASNKHYITPDEVAYKLIYDYHPIVLVDVRSTTDFNDFTLPGSINIPAEQIASRVWEKQLSNKEQKVVLYSNGTVLAEKAWMMAVRLGYENVYVLKGGLNGFFDNLINNPKPNTYKMEANSAYAFRERVRKIFKEGKADMVTKKQSTAPTVSPKSEVKVASRGGC